VLRVACERRYVVRRYLRGLACLLIAGAGLLGIEAPGAPALIGVTATAVAIAIAVDAGLGASENARARALILEGLTMSASAAFERESRRLRGRSRSLAERLEAVTATVASPRWLVRSSRPLFRLRVVAAVAPQLGDIAELLMREDRPLRGIALVARLLEEGDSPLYGDDPVELAETLRRIRFVLDG
jgi:hypothetical protein